MTTAMRIFGWIFIVAGPVSAIAILNMGGEAPTGPMALAFLLSGILGGLLLLGFAAIVDALTALETRWVDKAVREPVQTSKGLIKCEFTRTAGLWSAQASGHPIEGRWDSLAAAKFEAKRFIEQAQS